MLFMVVLNGKKDGEKELKIKSRGTLTICSNNKNNDPELKAFIEEDCGLSYDVSKSGSCKMYPELNVKFVQEKVEEKKEVITSKRGPCTSSFIKLDSKKNKKGKDSAFEFSNRKNVHEFLVTNQFKKNEPLSIVNEKSPQTNMMISQKVPKTEEATTTNANAVSTTENNEKVSKSAAKIEIKKRKEKKKAKKGAEKRLSKNHKSQEKKKETSSSSSDSSEKVKEKKN